MLHNEDDGSKYSFNNSGEDGDKSIYNDDIAEKVVDHAKKKRPDERPGTGTGFGRNTRSWQVVPRQDYSSVALWRRWGKKRSKITFKLVRLLSPSGRYEKRALHTALDEKFVFELV